MSVVDFLIVGGGLAAATAAETLRAEGAQGTIAMLAAEAVLPYHRPPLSKDYLLAPKLRDSLFIHEETFYRDHGIEVLLGTRALRVDPKQKRVETDRHGGFGFKTLLIATGARPRRLSVPGAERDGIFYLRTWADAEALRAAMGEARRAVVVGASFMALELTASLIRKGIATTVVAPTDTLYCRLESPEFSAFIAEYFEARGATILFEDRLSRIEGGRRVEGVATHGGRTLPCDLLAIGIGVEPDIGFLKDSGLLLDRGVVVDAHLETNRPGIYAAGDCARFFDPVFKRYRRIEHWDNAVKQGRIAARNMLGRRRSYRTVSYFFSDVFDLGFTVVGDLRDADHRIVRGSMAVPAHRPRDPGEGPSFSILYLKDRALRAALLVNRPVLDQKAVGALILNRVDLANIQPKVADPAFPLERAATQTVLILQGGGALGAFECGVVKAMEEKGIYPDLVAGISIGAFNAAIVASHPRQAGPALEAFWHDLSLATPPASSEALRRWLASSQALLFGSPKFFYPRWWKPVLHPAQWPVFWTSFYDTSPALELLRRHIDFQRLKTSPVRLLAGAVNVETAELDTFDSFIDELTPAHILASGSLPPGFPWTVVDGKPYWDGGLVSNSPLDLVIESDGLSNKKVYIVNLYPVRQSLPRNLAEVLTRRDEIVYAEKIRRSARVSELIKNFRDLVEQLMQALDPAVAEQIRQRPNYIETMGETCTAAIVRFVHEGEPGESAAKDYDFSRHTIEEHIAHGYRLAKERLEREI
ncbi:FAD-dependent oxidoreductase [Candidatus Methylocalor cossyra]|uniref:Ferredoxin reductase n=1 Tax=Candidatus Methylocalor cossyra TaxID=3108543 RepID=A0ABM9NML3_9GAMM